LQIQIGVRIDTDLDDPATNPAAMKWNSDHRADTDLLDQGLGHDVVEKPIYGRLVRSDAYNHAIIRNRRSGLTDPLDSGTRRTDTGSLAGSVEVE
jgi:hypothetical protein